MTVDERLENKINQEYELYYDKMMCASKEQLFAVSGEIERKKRITKQMRKIVGEASLETKELMIGLDNLIDSVNRFVSDYTFTSIREGVQKWLEEFQKCTEKEKK